jgi:hypothetical protein
MALRGRRGFHVDGLGGPSYSWFSDGFDEYLPCRRSAAKRRQAASGGAGEQLPRLRFGLAYPGDGICVSRDYPRFQGVKNLDVR